jgi:hypothetical protein
MVSKFSGNHAAEFTTNGEKAREPLYLHPVYDVQSITPKLSNIAALNFN